MWRLVTTTLTAMESSTGFTMPGTLALILPGLHHPHTAPLETIAMVVLEINSIVEIARPGILTLRNQYLTGPHLQAYHEAYM